MARSFTNANSFVPITSVDVNVYDGSSWQNLTNLGGDSRVVDLRLNYSHNTGRWVATATIDNTPPWRDANKSLDPGHTSVYNPSGVPLLGAYHDVKIYLTKSGGSSQLMFQGYVGPAEINPGEDVEKRDFFDATFVGIMQPYVDYWVTEEEGLVYSGNYLSIGTARDVLNQILVDYGFAENIVIEDTTLNYYVNSYEVKNTNLFDAIHRPVASIGYVLMEKYSVKLDFDAGTAEFTAGETVTGGSSSATGKVISWVVTSGTWAGGDAAGHLYLKDVSGTFQDNEILTGGATGVATANGTATEAFRAAVVDPDRDNTTPDIDLLPVEGKSIRAIKARYTEANVRTWVQVWYKDRNSGTDCNVVASSDSAKAIYGIPDGAGNRLHKKMRIVEKEGSWIDTRAEAISEATKALADVSTPCPAVTVSIPWLVLGLEGGDLLRVDTHSENDLDIGVTDIEWSLSPQNMYGTTTVSGTIERRVGHRLYWFDRSRTDLIGQINQDRRNMTGPVPDPPSEVEAEPTWSNHADGSPAPVLLVTWSGKKDWRVGGYKVRYKKCTLTASGTVDSAGDTSTIIDSTANWTSCQLAGQYLMLAGTSATPRKGADTVRRITESTGTTIYVDPPFDTAPDYANSEAYYVLKPEANWHYLATTRYPIVQIEGVEEGAYYIAEVSVEPRSYV